MKKVLVIDDNPVDNSGYTKELSKYYDVTVVKDLVPAERLIRNNKYDVIVIDVMMPTQYLNTTNELVTGFVFYEQIISKQNVNCPIIFWSRLYKDSYDDYFSNTTPPENSSFVHKDKSDSHLLSFINKIILK